MCEKRKFQYLKKEKEQLYIKVKEKKIISRIFNKKKPFRSQQDSKDEKFSHSLIKKNIKISEKLDCGTEEENRETFSQKLIIFQKRGVQHAIELNKSKAKKILSSFQRHP